VSPQLIWSSTQTKSFASSTPSEHESASTHSLNQRACSIRAAQPSRSHLRANSPAVLRACTRARAATSARSTSPSRQGPRRVTSARLGRPRRRSGRRGAPTHPQVSAPRGVLDSEASLQLLRALQVHSGILCGKASARCTYPLQDACMLLSMHK